MLFVTCKKCPGSGPGPELDRGLREGGGGCATHRLTYPIIYIDMADPEELFNPAKRSEIILQYGKLGSATLVRR